MKNVLCISACAALILIACSGGAGLEQRRATAEQKAEMATQKLTGKLLGEVQRAMKEGGAAGAVRICAEKAQAMTTEIAEAEGLTIRRVTDRPRNPLDEPDAYEKSILARFSELAGRDELLASSVHSEVVQINGKPALRYLKPITIKKPCLACHGNSTSLESSVRVELARRYPADKAIGYGEGDLRGAISVIVALDE
jgi:hypothetical protein